MITNQVIQKALDELKEITNVDLAVMELNGTQAAATFKTDGVISPVSIRSFLDSDKGSESNGEYNYYAYLLADENRVPIPVVKYAGTTKKEIGLMLTPAPLPPPNGSLY